VTGGAEGSVTGGWSRDDGRLALDVMNDGLRVMGRKR
jgi:hypothetical protein